MFLTLTSALMFILFVSSEQMEVLYKQPHQAAQQLMQMTIPSERGGNEVHSTDHDAPIVSTIRSMARNVDAQELQHILSREVIDNLTLQCSGQLRYLLDSAANKDMWALQVLDAWGKPEAGILVGTLNWLGDYPECISIKSTFNATTHPADTYSFQGKYCTGIHSSIVDHDGANVTVQYQLGLCVPSGCTTEDAASLYDFLVKEVAPESARPKAVCQPLSSEKEMGSGALATYIIYGMMVLLCVLAGIYDYSIHGTAMYYKVHRLPVPPGLLAASLPTRNAYHVPVPPAQRLSDDDEGYLIRNDGLEEVDDSDCSPVPQKYAPASSMETASLRVKEVFVAFSCYSNGYKILTPTQPEGAINCLHGIRFLSLSWVILGHTLIFSMQGIASLNVIGQWLNRFTFQAITNASFSVDSFFFISGLLTAYLMLRDFASRQIGLKEFLKAVPVLYLHRYLRLTPALGFAVLFWMYGIYNLTSGPMWPVDQITDPNCKNNSWATLFYLNNIYKPDFECAAWTWFLANDFQFYIVAPFLVGLLYWSAKIGICFNILLVLISCVTGLAVSYHYDLGISLVDAAKKGVAGMLSGHWFSDYYVAPWTRYQSYGVGILYGYVIWRTNGKLNLHRFTNLLLWAVSAVLCLLPLYGAYNAETGGHVITTAENVIYNGFSRTSWCIGLGYFVLACHCGRGGWVNELLSWKGFIPISRLTYCAYLIHPIVMTIMTFSQQSLIRYTDLIYIRTFISFIFTSYCLAFVFSLLFESPFLNIDKLFITGALKKKKD